MSDTKKDGGPAVVVSLMRGGFALVSPEDAERVLEFQWRLGSNGYIYCRSRIGQKHALLHRFITDASPGIEIHHDNETKTDCRRENLLLETPSSHQSNHHLQAIRDRNLARRKYPISKTCEWCSVTFIVHPDHRGRNRFCSKTCGNRFMGKKRRLHHG